MSWDASEIEMVSGRGGEAARPALLSILTWRRARLSAGRGCWMLDTGSTVAVFAILSPSLLHCPMEGSLYGMAHRNSGCSRHDLHGGDNACGARSLCPPAGTPRRPMPTWFVPIFLLLGIVGMILWLIVCGPVIAWNKLAGRQALQPPTSHPHPDETLPGSA